MQPPRRAVAASTAEWWFRCRGAQREARARRVFTKGLRNLPRDRAVAFLGQVADLSRELYRNATTDRDELEFLRPLRFMRICHGPAYRLGRVSFLAGRRAYFRVRRPQGIPLSVTT